MAEQETVLARKITLPLLVLYGLGVTIGAGIYVIIGAVTQSAGVYTPLTFIVASIVAGLTALSFAELSTRFPVSAGEAAYVEAGFGLRNLSTFIGLAIACSGAVSSATLMQGGVGYLQALTGGSTALLYLLTLVAIGLLVAWGISESVTVAAVFTVAEVGGLIAIIAFAPSDPLSMSSEMIARLPPLDFTIIASISGAVMLAFFAFIGFEDMVNVVEEVKTPDRTLPLAIILTLVITTILYTWIALIVITTVAPEELAASSAPLALLLQRIAGAGETVISLVAIGAVLNGAIIQLVMVSRVLYGLSKMKQIPAIIGYVSPITKTPLVATAIIVIAVGVIGAIFDLTALAVTTSSITLGAFAIVNLALWRIKGRANDSHTGFRVPRIVPGLGFLICGGFLVFEIGRKLTFS